MRNEPGAQLAGEAQVATVVVADQERVDSFGAVGACRASRQLGQNG
ncbi:MAG: hypothetical protein JWN43_2426 [Gammaproteobacteria bacterium]|nr:hypothetical protein [Gammaproteobacteria bacterium]